MSNPQNSERTRKSSRALDDSSLSRKSSSPKPVDSPSRNRTSSNSSSPSLRPGSKINRTVSEAHSSEKSRRRTSSSIRGSPSPSPADIARKADQKRKENLLGKSNSSANLVRKKKERTTRRKQISRSQEAPTVSREEEEENQFLDKYRTYTPADTKQFLGLTAEDGSDIENDILWSSEKRKPMLSNKDWDSYTNNLDEKFSLLIESPAGYHMEFGKDIGEDSSPGNELFLEDLPRYAHYYEKYFFSQEHINYIYIEDEKFPICVSVEVPQVKDQTSVKALIHTKDRDEPVLIMGASSKDRLRALKQLQERLSSVTLLKTTDPGLKQFLLNAEQRLIPKNYKFGILYMKEGQSQENEFFQNNVEEGSLFDDFLHLIGDRIELFGWDRFRGGLDTRRNATGTHSVFTTFCDYQVMFHVSGLLPFSPNDPQQIERKRHLGNDIVVLVFKEGDTPFNPGSLTSHYNHVFLVVQVHRPKSGDKPTKYRVGLVCKDGVPPCRPVIHNPPIYEHGTFFRDWLLTKLVNCERAAMYAPDFSHKDSRTRRALLNGMIAEHGRSATTGSIFYDLFYWFHMRKKVTQRVVEKV